MKCPVCVGENLMMTDRQGIEIDYCPKCRGIWLDRGELDKIIERSSVERPAQAPAQARPQPQQHYPQGAHHGSTSYGYKKKKKSILSEIFDF